jgi:hypothetical protein
MGTEGSHATAHHSPLAAGIVVGDFKSKARDEVPQKSKMTRIRATCFVRNDLSTQKISGN